MMNILLLAGSPSIPSRSTHLLHHAGEKLTLHGHRISKLQVRDLPAQALLHADIFKCRSDSGQSTGGTSGCNHHCNAGLQSGLEWPVVDLATQRFSWGAAPINEKVIAAQQNIADVFASLKLIPKKLVLKDAVLGQQ